MTSRRKTLADVATAAGVSTSTASRVLNGGAAVAEASAVRVREAAATLGYRLNPQARSLRTGRDTTIGLVVEDFNIALFARIASAVVAAAESRGVHVVIATSGTGASEQRGIEALASRNVAGLVVVEGRAGTAYLDHVGHTRPTVLVDAARPHPSIDTVTVDNHGGGRQATERLIAHGHTSIAFVGSEPSAKTVYRRYEGYAEALTAAGLPVRPELVAWAGLGVAEATESLRTVVPGWQGVTAAFTAVERTTAGLLVALAEHGRQSVEVMCFDDMDLGAVTVPPLSALAQDADTIGRCAAEMLFERIDGLDLPARHVQVPLQLVDRSTAPPHVGRPTTLPEPGRAADRLTTSGPRHPARLRQEEG